MGGIPRKAEAFAVVGDEFNSHVYFDILELMMKRPLHAMHAEAGKWRILAPLIFI